jgi:1-acyl-sn-glycerol-3-phosphate acyltransferase
VHHIDRVNDQQPLIICANHGNSFMDAILIAITFKRKIHFLARADVFNTPLKRWFLGKINMMPIYRIRDGRAALQNNDLIFKQCKEILDSNGAILIFPEGNCVVEKRLRTFKSGFVHLAFECDQKNLQVLPVTINYSKPQDFYTEVSLIFNEPIYVERIKTNTQNQFIPFSKALIADLQQSITKDFIMIKDKGDDEFYEQVLEITRNNFKNGFLVDQQNAVKFLNENKLNNDLLFSDLRIKLNDYFKALKKYNIKDEAVFSIDNYRLKTIYLIYPIYFLGWIIHLIPISILNFVINKKVRETQFKSAVRLVLGMLIYFTYIPILFYLFSKVLVFGSIFLIGILYFYNANFYHLTMIFQIRKIRNQNIELIKKRNEILALLNP